MDKVLLVVVASMLGLIFASLWIVVYQLAKQQGRLLLRLDDVERRIDQARPDPYRASLEVDGPKGDPQIRLQAVSVRLSTERPLSQSRILRGGLRAGTPAPAFQLPDTYGRMVSLEDYRGQPVLLVFIDPHCGPCDHLAPQLTTLHHQLWRELTLIAVGRGDPEENRRKATDYGFKFPVILQRRWELSKQYGIFATPVAFLIDERGLIARGVAKGLEEIVALARELLGVGKESTDESLIR